jgi:DNA invertase Pin-like site-specific DNA recombinase
VLIARGSFQIKSGKTKGTERPGLEECLSYLCHGDVLVVWRLDRLGRSISHLVGLIEKLGSREIKFKSIKDGAIDTSTASGELIFNIFASLSQFERLLIQERTKSVLKAARERGRLDGRPKIKSSHPKAKMMYKNKDASILEICKALKVSKATFYRYLSM